jgi:hypothetical protein
MNEQQNPDGSWSEAIPMPEPKIWKLWRFLRLMK